MKPYVTEEQIRAAKAVNTLAFLLRHQPERFKRVGRTEYRQYKLCSGSILSMAMNNEKPQPEGCGKEGYSGSAMPSLSAISSSFIPDFCACLTRSLI